MNKNDPQEYYMPGDILMAKRAFGSAIGRVKKGEIAYVLSIDAQHSAQERGHQDMYLFFRGRIVSRPLSPAAEAWDNDWDVL